LPESLAITALAFITFSAAMGKEGKTHQLEKVLMLATQQAAPKRIHFLQESRPTSETSVSR
jgi:hypothetical protein